MIHASTENTYWNNRGTLKGLYAALRATMPTEGACPADRPKLERLRRAGNAYYDLYNNGGCNRAGDIRDILGNPVKAFKSHELATAQAAVDHAEEVLDRIILAAAQEAGLSL